jgi:hypothetical protein
MLTYFLHVIFTVAGLAFLGHVLRYLVDNGMSALILLGVIGLFAFYIWVEPEGAHELRATYRYWRRRLRAPLIQPRMLVPESRRLPRPDRALPAPEKTPVTPSE